MDNNSEKSTPWFSHWWGIILLIVLPLVIITFIYIAFQIIFFGGKPASSLLDNANSSVDLDYIFQGSPKLVDSGTAPSLGDDSASVTIVEFCDFTDSYCKSMYPTLRDIVSAYSGYVRLVYRNYQVEQDEKSIRLAEAARCAYNQDRFWITHDRLFVNQGIDSDAEIKELVGNIGLNMESFNDCFDNNRTRDEVLLDYTDALKAGVRGTPTLFFNGYKVEGLISLQNFTDILGYLLPGLTTTTEETNQTETQ